MNSLATASSLSLRLLGFEHLPVCVPDFLVIRISSYLHFPRLLRTSRRECSLESAGASGVAGAEGPSGGPQWRVLAAAPGLAYLATRHAWTVHGGAGPTVWNKGR